MIVGQAFKQGSAGGAFVRGVLMAVTQPSSAGRPTEGLQVLEELS